MTDEHPQQEPARPEPPELRQWVEVAARARQMLADAGIPLPAWDDAEVRDLLAQQLRLWQQVGTPGAQDQSPAGWQAHPAMKQVRQGLAAAAEHLQQHAERIEGLNDAQRAQWRYMSRLWADAISPANFALTNPEVIARALDTRGESLLTGLGYLLADITRGQLTHSPPDAFMLGRDLATTPGKVILRTPLYELIHYAPTTERVLAVPLVIFPPWINRFYILDLTPEKSFIRWAVDQGISVFVVSWKSADASMADVRWDDYVAAQVEAVDTVRALLDVPAAHVIGYCVAGTTLAATLALLAARDEAGKVASATFLTAQVDFARAGDLARFINDDQLALVRALAPGGYVDGRYLAAAFNLLRPRDLIWRYVTDHYLLGKPHRPFDLLHWNGDVTNLPAGWHHSYLADLYRDNLLVVPGALSVHGTPVDLRLVRTPSYVQAGREDHISPAESVWEITRHFAGPLRFVLAGSGHIAGVVNPPAAGKYQYWVADTATTSFADFLADAAETKGSWWPDWAGWLRAHDSAEVPATGARVPGEGALPAIEDAPGTYVRQR